MDAVYKECSGMATLKCSSWAFTLSRLNLELCWVLLTEDVSLAWVNSPWLYRPSFSCLHALPRVKHIVDTKVTPHDPICSGFLLFWWTSFLPRRKSVKRSTATPFSLECAVCLELRISVSWKRDVTTLVLYCENIDEYDKIVGIFAL